ncbi:4-hydroxyphenylpyruvate dioxygenase [Nonomuraea sp. NPDC050202]|uniref:4-hydroxyphenylpyruvate dioxygenase n=1 Tax=Nonomuraea sp. NPDC050202 TaxID=3155035 RepID=UPI0033E592E7
MTKDDLRLDHIGFYVADLTAEAARLSRGYGLAPYAEATAWGCRSVAVGAGLVRFVLTQPTAGDHPGAAYLGRHGDGVADIALGVADATAAFRSAVNRGARPVSPPCARDGFVTAAVQGVGDVVHTFVQRPEGLDERALPGFAPTPAPMPATAGGLDAGLAEVDHLAVCVPSGVLGATVDFYRHVLDFQLIFAERITVGDQAMTTEVVKSGSVTLTLIEPDVSKEPGHIDEFLAAHGGAGVQHLAMSTADITAAVDTTGAGGVEFLPTPATYYDLLPDRVRPVKYPLAELRERSILVDEDHDGQLYQIFARSAHPRGTFFFELIERLGARSFGSGNIAALYQAVELQRANHRDARTEAAA